MVADLDSEAAGRVARDIVREGLAASPLRADVTRKESVKEMVGQALSLWNRIDILVNNAGGAIRRPVAETSESEWDATIELNLKSVFLCCQAVLPHMKSRRHGKIVSIASIYGFTGSAGRAAYSAAKAGVVAFTKSLALEVAWQGISVNAVAPGLTSTDRVRGRYTEEEWRERVSSFPLGRAAEPEEVARAVLFLAQDENSYITGQTIHVNGGTLMA